MHTRPTAQRFVTTFILLAALMFGASALAGCEAKTGPASSEGAGGEATDATAQPSPDEAAPDEQTRPGAAGDETATPDEAAATDENTADQAAPDQAAPDTPATTPAVEADTASAEELQTLAKGNNAFALALYQQLAGADPDGNLFFSPYSLSTALTMTYAGARGETAEQMRDTLHFALDDARLHDAAGQLIDSLATAEDGPVELTIANRLFGEKTVTFEGDFTSTLRLAYDAPLEAVDYKTDVEVTRKYINSWVEGQTKDKIQELIPQGILDTDTRLVLANAIYFKGDWASQFDAGDTRDQPFTTASGSSVDAPLMHQKGDFRMGFQDGVQLLELPYAGDRLSMVVILPPEGGLTELEKQLDADTLTGWMGSLGEVELDVYLPRFTMTQQFELADTLGAMGMPLAFSTAADLSGMTGDDSLELSAVVHKAFIEVNEEGTEAAAATGVVAMVKGMTPSFRADRAFLFAIRDQTTGSILFMGRVADPTATGG